MTVGKAVTKMELSAALSELFEGGRPCSGIPWDEDEEQPSQYVIQTPVSGKSSKTCHVLLGKDIDPDTVSCAECLKLCGYASGLVSEVESKVETDELEESKPENEKENVFTHYGNTIDDHDRNISHIENNDEDNILSAHEDLNEDSDCYEGVKDQETDSQHQCTLCEKSYAMKSYLEGHYRRFHLKGKFKCPDCEFKANFAHVLIKHIQENKHESRISCPNCSEKGKDCRFSNLNISSHYKTCLQKTCDCPYCDLAFGTNKRLVQHKKIVHLWGKFSCNQCDFR